MWVLKVIVKLVIQYLKLTLIRHILNGIVKIIVTYLALLGVVLADHGGHGHNYLGFFG